MALEEHYRNVRSVLFWVLILNWAVAFAKIFYGLISHITSMTADGFHSLSDGSSNIIGLIGIRLACQPKDQDHPYGHKKYETFFSLGIALLLFFICFNIIREGISRIFHPANPEINMASFIVMFITLAINIWVMNYEFKKGKLLQSDILISDSMHTKADIFTSLSVIIALVAIKLGYPIIDPVTTILIALFIAHAGIGILREGSKVLCDTAAIVDIERISGIVLAIEGVEACHKIRTRGRPDDIHVDLHVQVKPNMHIDKAHKVCYAIEEAIKKNLPEITDVIVHMEPKDVCR